MASASESLRAAAALGAASGARSFAGAAALALAGRPRAGWARAAILTLAGGEAVADKLPVATPRSDPPALAGRVVAGAAVGAASAGARGAGVGALFALATTRGSERARALLGAETGLPDPAVAVAEDALVYGGAYLAAAGRLPDRPLPALLAAPLGALVGVGAIASARHAYRKLRSGAPAA